MFKNYKIIKLKILTTMDTIYILDFGSQYSQLIARRVRNLGVYAELVPYDVKISMLKGAKGIILSGGPESVYAKGAPKVNKKIYDLKIPLLGICYGMQLITNDLGGKVVGAVEKEYGPADLKIIDNKDLFVGLGKKTKVWMSHGDRVEKLPSGFELIASTANSPDAVMSNKSKNIYGIQFHPEVEHTTKGMKIIENFVIGICKAKKEWKIEDFIERQVMAIREQVGDAKVICGVSGGVDSTVTAALMGRAIGKNLIPVFVNHGFMRAGETAQVKDILRNRMGLPLRYVNAEKRFLDALKGVDYGEKKRKIIGKEFIKVFTETVKHIKPRPNFLAQGTIHSDAVTSAKTATGKKTALIKSHHNVGGLPKNLKLDLVEPLRDIFKDEVREVGVNLGLPEDLVWRQPFPGPGLAVRVAGEVTKQKLDILRLADKIVQEEVIREGWQKKYYHYFAQLLSQKTVGVKGDERAYSYPIVVKIITSSDIMTYDWARLPDSFLERVSFRITNEVADVTRVLYDISTKPPATVEWE